MTNRERIENFDDQERYTFMIMISNDCRVLKAKWFNAEFVSDEKFWEDIKNGGEDYEN